MESSQQQCQARDSVVTATGRARDDFESPVEGHLTQSHSRKRFLAETTLELSSVSLNNEPGKEAGVTSSTEVLLGTWSGMIENLE